MKSHLYLNKNESNLQNSLINISRSQINGWMKEDRKSQISLHLQVSTQEWRKEVLLKVYLTESEEFSLPILQDWLRKFLIADDQLMIKVKLGTLRLFLELWLQKKKLQGKLQNRFIFSKLSKKCLNKTNDLILPRISCKQVQRALIMLERFTNETSETQLPKELKM